VFLTLPALVACKAEKRVSDTTLTMAASNSSPPIVVSPACDANARKAFPSVEAALASILATKPRIVAVGETHARRDAPDVVTATERFGSSLLPVLKAHGAQVLIVELLNPPSGCTRETAAVAEVQKPVVEQQDTQNQDRFVALGHRARALGLTPLVLEPSCEEFAAVRQAGADGVAAMLDLIAQHTSAKLERLLTKSAPEGLIVTYGGAVHNDVGQDAPFAFGERLRRSSNGKYVAIDLIVPEYVADTDAWKKLPWYPCWPDVAKTGVTLVQVGPVEFTLFMEPALKR
jgi:hypothetical protein